MPISTDQDRFFSGQIEGSTPKHLIGEGSIARLINGQFVEGSITNGVGFDEVELELDPTLPTHVFPGNITYAHLLSNGDFQILAPLKNEHGLFLVAVISGIIFLIDVETGRTYDITPRDAFIQTYSRTEFPLTALQNDNGVYGINGYVVLFNYPNRPILINSDGARVSSALAYEIPPSKFGVTAGVRMFVISGKNLLYASDPFGGSSPTAPLTFREMLEPGADYLGQIFAIGSDLDNPVVTGLFRLPRLFGPDIEFQAQNILATTKNNKFIISGGTERSMWSTMQFITNAGTLEGVAGPAAGTNIGSTLVFMAPTGRIKTLGQDQERETALAESYFDESLGQYLGPDETEFHFRKWYRNLHHKYSQLKFSKDRLYATVYPYFAPSLGVFNDPRTTPTHRALAIGSLDPATRIGPTANIAWEGFYDWLQPAGLAVLEDTLYVFEKTEYGLNRLFRQNYQTIDNHPTTIITRGYLNNLIGKSKGVTEVSLFFRVFTTPFKITVSTLIDGSWEEFATATVSEPLCRLKPKMQRKTNSASIPLKIELDHKGARFELEAINVVGEIFSEEKR